MIIEIVHAAPSSGPPAGSTATVRELQQRTDRALADLAPYAHASLVRAHTRKPALGLPDHQLPVLVIDSMIVLAHTTPPRTPRTPLEEDTPSPLAAPPDQAQSAPLPSQQQIDTRLAQALLSAGPSAIRLPLVHRRMVAIALLLMVIGALLSSFVAPGPVLTYAGLLLLPVGLSTNGTRSRTQPLMLIAGAAVTLSGLLLLWYFGPLIFSGAATAIPPSVTILYSSLLCLCLAWGAALAALIARRRLRQKLRYRLLQVITRS